MLDITLPICYHTYMPKVSKHRREKIDLKKARAFELYKSGLSLRDVGFIVERSHQWVFTAVNELEKLSTVKS